MCAICWEMLKLTLKHEEWRLLRCYAVWLLGSYKSHTAYIPEDAILHVHRRENLKS
jgi:hypothetical protein